MAIEEWIAIRLDLAQDPDVIRMAGRMQPAVRPEVVVGYLCSVWSWASKATDDGIITGLTLDQIETTLHLPMFLHRMQEVGWVSEVVGVNGSVVTFENWQVWNSESRKKRLKEAKRKQLGRKSESGQMSAELRTNVRENPDAKRTRSSSSSSCSSSCSSGSVSNNNKDKKTRKIPPDHSDVKAYWQEKRFTSDVEEFLDYYESNGWRVGRNPMKDWRRAASRWERRQHEFSGGGDSKERKGIEAHKRLIAAEMSRREAEELKREQGRSQRRSSADASQSFNQALNQVMREVDDER